MIRRVRDIEVFEFKEFKKVVDKFVVFLRRKKILEEIYEGIRFQIIKIIIFIFEDGSLVLGNNDGRVIE